MNAHIVVRGQRLRASRPLPVLALVLMLGALAIGGFQGGIAMVTNPTDPLGMSTDFLSETPVGDYFLPGLFLLAVATASLITATGLFVGWEWRWAYRIEVFVGHRWPWVGAMSIGVVLLLFEIVELFMVPFHPVMHPLLIGWCLAIVILALAPSARAYLRAPGRLPDDNLGSGSYQASCSPAATSLAAAQASIREPIRPF